MFNQTIWTGIGVVAGLFAILWAFGRWGKLGGVVMMILVVIIGGSYVKPIRDTANGVIAVAQAPLTAAKQLLNKRLVK